MVAPHSSVSLIALCFVNCNWVSSIAIQLGHRAAALTHRWKGERLDGNYSHILSVFELSLSCTRYPTSLLSGDYLRAAILRTL